MTETEVNAIVQAEIDASEFTSGRASLSQRRKFVLFGAKVWIATIRFRGGKHWCKLTVDDATGEVLTRTYT